MAYTINNCIIYDCNATDDGGGIYVFASYDVHITDVEIHDCLATDDGGGIYINGSANITIDDCYIYENEANEGVGGGIAILEGDVEIKNSIILDNYSLLDGGSIYNAGAAYSDDVEITNCVVAQGSAGTGKGGIACESTSSDADLVITNCTIADTIGTGIYRTGGTVVVVNCILWGNDTNVSGTMTITYSDVEGSGSGTNVDDDPLFFGGTGKHQYALNGISECVDSANSGATYYESTDILGASRYDHPDVTNTGAGTPAYVDMGAYEFQGVPVNTLNYSNYHLNLNEDDPSLIYYLYAIVRLPEMPQQFATLGHAGRNVRHQISSEIKVDDADAVLDEYVTIDSHLVCKREVDSTVYATPTRAVDYESAYQSESDAHVAEETAYPVGSGMVKVGAFDGFGENFRYAIITMAWTIDNVSQSSTDALIFNVDINQIHDGDYNFGDFVECIHPGASWMGPDVPLSAFHMQSLQESLLKILYEATNTFSIPVYGLMQSLVV